MKTKNIFNCLAMAMLLPTMLLTTACSNDDDAVNNDNTAKKGFPLQVTVNVTRQGDEGTTRATYNESTKKLEFSEGDQLFVEGYYNETVGNFAGTLDMVSAGTFSGTIYTQNAYTGTADAILAGATRAEACLLPNGYATYNYLHITNEGTYSANDGYNANNAFATTKATAVEQFSREKATSYSSGFALSPANAILNFTISGLTASASVDIELTGPGSLDITRLVTTDGSGNATFAVGVEGGTNFNTFSLTVGGNAITLASGSKTLEAGHIYNVTRSAVTLPEGALSGKFTINESGDQVFFSKGNLQATTTDLGANWSWAFAEHQWDYIGEAEGNTSINGDGTVSANSTVDLFGWVGASNTTWTGAAQYGVTNSTTVVSADTYGNVAEENLKSDWGNTIDGTGTTWRTLTSDEWVYLFNTRTDASSKYGHGKINNICGMIILPDSWTLPTDLSFTAGNSAYTNRYTTEQWTQMESAGAVFLPAAGFRNGSLVSGAGGNGRYWSSSPYTSKAHSACSVYFLTGYLEPQYKYWDRYHGHSVRLVREVE